MPSLLHKSAGCDSCCIFRVPQSLVEINRKAYEPHIVSIGPYHHGKDHLKMIEEHKWRFLGSLLSRTQSNGQRLALEDYYEEIASVEDRVRQSYSGDIEFSSDKFIEMMVFDGCFIIEIFRIVGGLVFVDQNDPIFTMQWIFSSLMRDLIKLENQIPFFVLQRLFNLSKQHGEPSLSTFAFKFFNNALQRPEEVLERYSNLDALHLLGLLRLSLIPINNEPKKTNSSPKIIPCATKLSQTGFKFKARKSDTLLDISFRNGVIEIPTVAIDDFTTSNMHINTYAAFLGCLIKTPKDIELLQDTDIIENYFGTNEEVARFFNDLGKDVALDIEMCYLSKLFEDTNEYYRNTWHVQWASFKHTYFDTPWSFLSALAAVILLLLTLAQTVFSVFGYIHPSS
ncbi:hypothetical protein AQUCO_02700396v1 [Aquilegia coerulea]|uniref:Uncharacterized protein n=1 Tax=Aquilegia coerulea TaxID=218851 RepID=A0A2G5D6P4_AQUCA|nr:hypothetical protein AQUCO_02700396v1 [Aquilegia coerulea]